MISSINSYNWYPSLFQSTAGTQTNNTQSNLAGITNVDNTSMIDYEEQSLNVPSQNSSTYDLLNNISNTSSFSGILNLDQYAQINYQEQSTPSLYQMNQAFQSYTGPNLYSPGTLYDQPI